MRELTDHTERNRRRRIARPYRRVLLASALMLAASPTSAENNHHSTIGLAAPLPQAVRDSSIQRNPFFAKDAQFSSPIMLASGKEQPSIRLKPIGAAIGLQPIGSGAAVAVRPSAMTITEPLSEIRANPLIDSEPDKHLIETTVTPATDRLQEAELMRRDSSDFVPLLTEKPMADDQVSKGTRPLMTPVPKLEAAQPAATQPMAPAAVVRLRIPAPVAEPTLPIVEAPAPNTVLAAPVNPAPAAPIETLPPQAPESVQSIPTEIAQPAPLQRIPSLATDPELVAAPSIPAPALQRSARNEAAVEDGGDENEAVASPPVFFSMSDSSSATDAAQDFVHSPGDLASESDLTEESNLPARVVNNPLVALAVPPVIAEPIQQAQPVQLPEPITIAEVDPTNIESDDEAMMGLSIVKESLDPLRAFHESASRSTIYRNEAAEATAGGGEPSLVKKRYRPPVAVDAPPLTIERAGARAVTSIPAVASSPVVDTASSSQTENVLDDNSESTKLHMTRAQVRSLTLGGEVRKVSVADKNVCQAFATGPNQLKLIGVGNGVTRLVVWAETSSQSPTRVKTFEIHVNEAVEASGDTLVTKIRLLNRSIANAFPHVRVSVQQHRDQLIVAGQCDDDETAKKIIRMVRKTCLIPVRDEINVR